MIKLEIDTENAAFDEGVHAGTIYSDEVAAIFEELVTLAKQGAFHSRVIFDRNGNTVGKLTVED